MSTPQRNDARVIAVDPSLVEILRLQTLVVLEVNHHYFEDIRTLSALARHALATIYRDAFAVLDAVGWTPAPNRATTDVRLTAGHIAQLRRRRHDLGRTNLDRLDTRDQLTTASFVRDLDAEIAWDRTAAKGLDKLIAAYRRAADT
jgi:hypothetical protein